MIPQWFKAFDLERQHRRKRQRVARYFDCRWQSAWGPQRSRVSSISPTGCYIEDRFTVPARGAAVGELTIELPTGRINLQGMVIDAMKGVGFSVRFTEVDADAREHLSALVGQTKATESEPVFR